MPESNNQTSGLNEKYTKLMNDFISQYGNVSQSQKMQIYRRFYNAQAQEEKNKKEEEASMELIQRGADTNDPKYRNTCNGQVNIHAVAKAIRDKTAEDPNFEYDLSDCDDNAIIDWYTSNNPSLKSELDKVLCSESDLTTFLQQHGLEKKTVRNTNDSSITEGGALGILGGIGAGVAGLTTAVAGTDTFGNIADWVYRQNINQSYQDTVINRKRTSAPLSLEETNKQIEEIQKLLEESQKANVDDSIKATYKKYYENELEKLNKNKLSFEKTIEKYSPEYSPTTQETAYKYGIKGMTPNQIAGRAESKADLLWKEIENKLESSTQTVNLKDLLDRVDIDELAKLEGDKSSMQAAIDMLKEEYKDPMYGKLNMKDANSLKSALYGKMPSSYWNGKDITNQYKKVLGEVASMLKEETQTKLGQEFGEDFSKKFADWGNLHEIATKESEALQGKGAVGGKIGALSTIWDTISTPISSEGGYYLKKLNEGIKSIPGKIKGAVTDAVGTIKNNPAKAVKTAAKGVKETAKGIAREMPIVAGMEAINESYEYNLENEMGGYADGFLRTAKSQWDKINDKEGVIELLKNPKFIEAAEHKNLDINELIEKFGITKKDLEEINTALDNQKKEETKSKQAKIQGSTVEGKLKTELENNDKTNPLLKKTTALKNQKATILTKKKSSK